MGRKTNLLSLAGGVLIGSVGLVATSTVLTGITSPGSAQSSGTHRPSLLHTLAAQRAFAAQVSGGGSRKPNILFIMGDDIGWMQPSIYHRGLMVGETPSIDRIGHEGAMFVDYVAMQSCTSGRNAFFTGMYPLRTGLIPPELPGSPAYLRPGTPALAVFLRDQG